MTLSPAAVARFAKELDLLGDRAWLLSEDILAESARLKAEARLLREMLEQEREAEGLREYAGPTLRVAGEGETA